MIIIGQIILSKTSGRRESWVTKKVETDYFLTFKIVQIGNHQITTTKDVFSALKENFPKIEAYDELLNDLFDKMSLPPNVEDISNIALGNFPDFRFDRDVANDVDIRKVEQAQQLNGEIFDFEITPEDFELVATCNTDNLKLSYGVITKAKTVGFNRDAIINIKPSPQVQEKMNKLSRRVFGDDYVLWNSQKEPVPYHLTIAQTNKLGKRLSDLEAQQMENRQLKL